MNTETPITKLTDGSAFLTTTIMSEDEAMALPLKERPLKYRISSEIYHAVFQSIGEASLCWNPKPSKEVFDWAEAEGVAVRLCFKIADEIESLREALEHVQFYANTGVLQESLDQIKRITDRELTCGQADEPQL